MTDEQMIKWLEKEAAHCDYIGSLKMGDGYKAIAARLRELAADNKVLRDECMAWREHEHRGSFDWPRHTLITGAMAATDARTALENTP